MHNLLARETHLDLEQRNLAEARGLYQGDPRVHIPALFPHCTPRVTAMERIAGEKVTEHRLQSRGERRWLTGVVAAALVARPLFSQAGRSLFHADPHAGNLMLTKDRRLAILDWSLVGRLAEGERQAMAQIALGAITRHAGPDHRGLGDTRRAAGRGSPGPQVSRSHLVGTNPALATPRTELARRHAR